MTFKKGNRAWEARTQYGREKIFKTPEIMLNAANEYFNWVADNPLEKQIIYQGKVSDETEKLMRAMTIGGLCTFWDVNSDYLTDFVDNLNLDPETGPEQDRDFSRIIKRIRQVIYNQKFEGASAGLLNSNIIARELGLADKQANEITGKDGGPIETTTIVFKPVGKDD